MGRPPLERWGSYTGVAWVSFSRPSMRRARGLPAGLGVRASVGLWVGAWWHVSAVGWALHGAGLLEARMPTSPRVCMVLSFLSPLRCAASRRLCAGVKGRVTAWCTGDFFRCSTQRGAPFACKFGRVAFPHCGSRRPSPTCYTICYIRPILPP